MPWRRVRIIVNLLTLRPSYRMCTLFTMATKKSAKSTTEILPTVNDVYVRVIAELGLKRARTETATQFRNRVERSVSRRWQLRQKDGSFHPISVSLLRKFRSNGDALRRPYPKTCPQFYKDLRTFFPSVDPLTWYETMPAGRDRRRSE